MTSRTAQPRGAGRRTSVSTRRTAPRERLIRWFDGPEGTSWPDWTGRSAALGGKGVYTEPSAEAVREAIRRKRLKGDPTVLVGRLVESGERVWAERLGLATRANAIAVGQTAVRERMRDGQALLLLVAADAGNAVVEKVTRNAERKGTPYCTVSSGEVLGRATGREFVSCVLVEQPSFATDLLIWSEALASLGSGVVRGFVPHQPKIHLETSRSNE